MSHASSSKVCKYDVFLSFRGKDTRRTFTSHLYNALKQRGIPTFKDDERLKKGKTISGELLKAIEEAKFAVVIFSKRYASSRWCLEELAHIIKCKNESEQIVIPVFHDVNPSDVRHQNPPFAKSFSKHEKKYKDDLEKVRRWRDAFAVAGKISGYHLQNFKDEADCIKKLVDDIFPKSLQVISPFPKSLVGMKSQVEKLTSLLDMESNDVRSIGIWGMGGIGKTKIASVIYQKYRHRFEADCFLSGVGTLYQKNGLTWLAELVIYKLLGEKMTLTSEHEGKIILKNMLCWKKVLFILDDVDHREQLEFLVGGPEWFGVGSRIILIARDKQLLISHVGDNVYEVQLLTEDEALELFIRHAFREKSPTKDLMKHSREVVEYAGGLPLALEVFGSLFHNRDKEQWRHIIDRLKRIPPNDILGKLRFSFDGLDKDEKKIFLDIAFICIASSTGYSFDLYVELVLETCGFKLIRDYLIEKSLLSINIYNRIVMHDMIRDMAANVIMDEYANSRVWLPEEVRGLLKGKLLIEKVENLCIPKGYNFEDDPVNYSNIFRRMQSLQVLVIGDETFSSECDITYLPSTLRFIEWEGYPSISLPENFEPSQLVVLCLRKSRLVKLGPMSKKLINLKYLDLSWSSGLTKITNFGDMPNLKTLNLWRCENLEEVHPSLEHCRMLTVLDLNQCGKLKKLPELKLSNLKQLNLRCCLGLTETPNFGDMPNLETLNLCGCENLEEVHPSLGHCRMLRQLNLSECGKLKKLPELKLSNLKQLNLRCCLGLTETPNFGDMPNLETLNLCGCENLEEVHPSLEHCRMLRELDLSYCDNLKKLPELKLSNLKQLHLRCCRLLTETSNFGDMPNLKTLKLCECENLEEVHPSLEHCRMLRQLDLSECGKLKKLSELKLSNLKQLNLRCCRGLTETPNFGDMPNLETINLRGCENLEEVHPSLGHCRMLRVLDLSECGKLKKLPELKLSNLKQLNLHWCRGLTETPNFGDMPNLKTLNLCGCENLEEVHPSLEHCRMLRQLDLSECGKLKKLSELKFSNLKQLNLRCCRGLTETPNFGDMPNLKTLNLWRCENLEEVHPSLEHCRMLTVLDLNQCGKLKKLPELKLSNLKQLNLRCCLGLTETPNFGDMPNLETLNLCGCENLEEVHPSLGHCRMLRQLDLSECGKLKKLSELKFSNLKQLNLRCCRGLTETPNFGGMPNLETLNLCGCENLEEVHPSLGHCRMLRELNLSECGKLKKLPELKLSNLKQLNLHCCRGLTETPNFGDKCTSLEKFPEIHGDMRRLTRLAIKSTGIRELPTFIGNLSGLIELDLKGCEDLVSLPDNLCNLNNLKHLDLRGCKKLEKLPENVGELQELETLDAIETAISQPPPSITKLGKLSNLSILGGLPEDLGSLQSLKCLDVSGSNISCLPKSIKELLGLKNLNVQFCQNLNELPEKLPPNLKKLCADYHLALKSIRDLVIKYLKLCFISISWCGQEKSEYGIVSSEQVNVLKFLQHLIRTCIQCHYQQRDYFLISFPQVRIPELFDYQFMNQKHVSIDLNPSWYNDKFKGFSICHYSDDGGVMLVATLVCKSGPGRKHALQYSLPNFWLKSATCFIYIPFETLWHASDNKEGKNPNDYCLFEVYLVCRQGADWGDLGIRLEYENNDTAVTTKICWSMELEQPELSLTFGHFQASAEHNIATDRGLHLGNENKDVEVDQAAMAVQKEHESQNVELARVCDSPSRKMDDASRKRNRKRKRNRNKKRKIAGTDETSCSHFTN